ncbi:MULTISPECIES: BRO-N domain-containing protein [Pectinatus]|uniref:BRO-N domain-containing protein n=1 Tax=Pectinatus TaxID=864 RepID=UPI0018C72AE4|nr:MULTISPECIES: Bro-N domain-containing protein [Pectinatus]
MNDLQIFENKEFGKVRTILIENEPWFVAKDVCDCLEIGNNRQALTRLDDDEKDVISNDTPGGKQKLQAVNEYGLYSLVLSSRKKEAKQFKRWITHEVIPAIRKTGSYATQKLSPQLQVLINLEMKQKEHDHLIAEANKRIDGIRNVVALNPNDWRKESSALLNKMALSMGGYEHVKPLRAESYKLLDERMGVDLQCRLTNKRRRMADEGICKSRRDRLNQLDVIAEDKKLIEGYVAIIKEMAIKYGAAA